MSDLEVIKESLTRLAERVHRLERVKDDSYRDGRRRVLAYLIVRKTQEMLRDCGAHFSADFQAKFEEAVREILKENDRPIWDR